MRLGILGGTFDPIHNGHLHMALCAQKEYGLDEVWLMPTGPSPHKEDAQITSCEHRVNMARLALEDLQKRSFVAADDPLDLEQSIADGRAAVTQEYNEGKISQSSADCRFKMIVSTLETDSNERSYTWRTLQRIHQIRPQDEVYFIVGADSLSYMDHWVHPEIIFRNAVILAAGRDAWHEKQIAEKIAQLQEIYSADVRIVHCENLAVASRDIRRRIAAGEDVSEWIPKEVEAYIQKHGLYRNI